MKHWTTTLIAAFTVASLSVSLASFAQQLDSQDTSPHKIQFIEVEKDVSLEVADWGGEGPVVVLLAGIGGTVHSYDQFAPKLAKSFHVYGITRRGFGASSKPPLGYAIQILAHDVEKVIDALNLTSVLLVGHSIAGQELDIVAVEDADKIKGLVYLDAAFDYTDKVSEEYESLMKAVTSTPSEQSKPKERPTSIFDLSPTQKIFLSSRRYKPDYANIKTPALAIVALPRDASDLFDDYKSRNADTRAKMDQILALHLERAHRQEKEFTDTVKNSKAIEIVGARHDVYRSNEAEVLKAITEFAKPIL
jgi:non-heme chloroperoxidase